MKALLWKEARELAWPFGMFLALFAALAVVGVLWPGEASPGKVVYLGAFLVWWALSPLLAALWGAHTLARERSHGTLEWFGALPVSRSRAWAVKLIVSLVLLGVFCAVTIALARLIQSRMARAPGPPLYDLGWLPIAAPLLFFCLGFAISGTRRHTFESVLVTILAFLMLAGGWLFLAADLLPRFWGPQLGIIYSAPNLSTYAWLAGVLSVGFLIASAVGWIGVPLLSFGRRYWRTVGWTAGLVVVGLAGLVVGVRYTGQPQPRDLHQFESVRTSPDGNWIAFTDVGKGLLTTRQDPSPWIGRLWLMRMDGTGLRCLARGPVWDFLWEPDSRRILLTWGDFEANLHFLPDTSGGVWEAEVGGGGLRRLAAADEWVLRIGVAVSPGGKYAKVGDRFLQLGSHPVWTGAEISQGMDFRDWGPGDSGFFFMAADGKQLSFCSLPDGGLRVVQAAPADSRYPVVSPRGDWIAWSRVNTPKQPWSPQESKRASWITRVGETTSLAFPGQAGSPSWSLNGRYLWLMDGPGGELVIVDLTGPGVLRTIPRPGHDATYSAWEDLSWSLDGRRVVVFSSESQHGTRPARRLMWTARADGNGLRQVAEVSLGNYFSCLGGWTRDEKIILLVHNETHLVALDPDTGQEKDLLVVPAEVMP